MAVYVNSFFEEHVEQLFEFASVVERAFSAAGIEYRVVGGLAAYLYGEEIEEGLSPALRERLVAVRAAA